MLIKDLLPGDYFTVKNSDKKFFYLGISYDDWDRTVYMYSNKMLDKLSNSIRDGNVEVKKYTDENLFLDDLIECKEQNTQVKVYGKLAHIYSLGFEENEVTITFKVDNKKTFHKMTQKELQYELTKNIHLYHFKGWTRSHY